MRNFLENKKIGRCVKFSVLAFALFATFVPLLQQVSTAHAQLNDPTLTDNGCTFYKPWTWAICLIEGPAIVIGGFLKVVLNIAAWFMEIVIQLNQNIIQTPSVQIGYSIS